MGCLSSEDLTEGLKAAQDAFWSWFDVDEAEQRAARDPGEFDRIEAYAVEQVESKSDAQCWQELGGGKEGKPHAHAHAVAAAAAEGEGDGTEKKKALSVRMKEYVEEHYVLFRGDDGIRYAVKRKHGHIAEPITSEFVIDATLDVFAHLDSTPAAAKKAVDVLVVLAKRGPKIDLNLRFARSKDGGTIWLDLAQDKNTRCVEVKADGWEVRDAPPEGVLFRRSAATKPLPTPERAGSLDELRELLGWEEDDVRWRQARGWIVGTAFCDIARPHLIFEGNPGSAKTTRARMVVGVWDPKGKDALGGDFGKNLDDDRVKALGSYLVAYDNLGRVSKEVSDHLARMSTGDLATKRKLYSDLATITIEYRRAGVMTALSLAGINVDTIDRLVGVHCDRLTSLERLSERQLWAAYQAEHARLVGAGLDAIVLALKGLPAVLAEEGAEVPRMTDYYQVIRAWNVEDAEAYREAARVSMESIAENDSFVSGMVAFLRTEEVGGYWKGSASELWEATSLVRLATQADDGYWPKDATVMSRELSRNAPAFEAVGIRVSHPRTNRGRFVELDGGVTGPVTGDGSHPSPVTASVTYEAAAQPPNGDGMSLVTGQAGFLSSDAYVRGTKDSSVENGQIGQAGVGEGEVVEGAARPVTSVMPSPEPVEACECSCSVNGCETFPWAFMHLDSGTWWVCGGHAEIDKLNLNGTGLEFAA